MIECEARRSAMLLVLTNQFRTMGSDIPIFSQFVFYAVRFVSGHRFSGAATPTLLIAPLGDEVFAKHNQIKLLPGPARGAAS